MSTATLPTDGPSEASCPSISEIGDVPRFRLLLVEVDPWPGSWSSASSCSRASPAAAEPCGRRPCGSKLPEHGGLFREHPVRPRAASPLQPAVLEGSHGLDVLAASPLEASPPGSSCDRKTKAQNRRRMDSHVTISVSCFHRFHHGGASIGGRLLRGRSRNRRATTQAVQKAAPARISCPRR